MVARTAPLAELLADLARALGGLDLRWYLFGAQAAILHGATRLTADVDVTVALAGRSVGELVAAAGAAGFDARFDDVVAFADSTSVVPLVHRATRIPVDLILAGPGLEERFLSRAEVHEIGGARIPVAAPEDLVAMKLLAGREKDLDDAAAMLRTRGAALRREIVLETLLALEQALDRADLVSTYERLLAAVQSP